MTEIPSEDALRKGLLKSRLGLILLALLFFGPLLFSWGYHLLQPKWRPAPVSHGELITPPPSLVEAGDARHTDSWPRLLLGHWSLLFVGGDTCDQPCQALIYDLRQIRASLGKDADRVQRVYLSAAGGLPKGLSVDVHPDLIPAKVPPDALPKVLGERLRSGDTGRDFFLVDPNGLLILRYGKDYKQRGVQKDIRHLLKFSSIG